MFYKLFFISLLFFCFCLFSAQIRADAPKIYTANSNQIAIEGYDVTTYYTVGKPLMGSPDHQVEYEGAHWYFVNKKNLDKFKHNPELYAPQYGGYCVWAIAHGRLTGGLPHIWRIINGKLYLLCSYETLEKWMNQRELINRQADEQWPGILSK